jgi:sortase A
MKKILINLTSLALILAGLALISTLFVGPFWRSSEASGEGSRGTTNSSEFNVPTLESGQKAPSSTSGEDGGYSPEDKSLTMTVSSMRRVENDTIPTTEGDDEQALKKHAAIHLEGTGFPWQKGSNVYIAGHRLGYPGTNSFLAFYDLDSMKRGDKVTLEDANGKKYTYRVYKKFVAEPTRLSVTQPVEGKSVLTLQTCTLPDYSKRLIVRAEKVG